MRKIAILLFAIVFGFKGFAQDDVNESKNFRLGLHFDPYINWYNPVDQRRFENGGTKLKFSIGAVTDFKLGGNVWLSTGIGFSFLGGAYNFLEDNNYSLQNDTYGYFLHDNEIIDFDELDPTNLTSAYSADTAFIGVTGRNIRARYLTLPLLLKIKTKEIGYLTYFGQFGAINHIKMGSVKTDDTGNDLTSSNSPDLTQLLIDNEPSLFQVAANIGFGVEYNISGSTSLYGSLQLNYGLNSALKRESEHIVRWNAAAGQFERYDDKKINMHSIVLSIGVLF